MTTALALSNAQLATMTDAELDALMAQQAASEIESGAFDFQIGRITMPSGKSKSFQYGDNELKSFEAIIVVAQKGFSFYPGRDSSKLRPACSSPDGVNGFFRLDDDDDQMRAAFQHAIKHPAYAAAHAGPWECARCPLRYDGCKSQIRSIVLLTGEIMPALFKIPAMSVKHFNDYASNQSRRGTTHAYFSAVVEFSVTTQTNKKGTDYSELSLKFVRDLSMEEKRGVLALRGKYSDYVRSRQADDVDYEAATVVDVATGEIHPF